MDSLRVALVGCGQWGLNYLRAFGELTDCEVAAVCDLDAERIATAERRAPGVWSTTNPAELLADPSVTAVVVATQARFHHEVARAALVAGKDVLVEKPLTVTVEDARDLRDVARAEGRILMVGHVFRYNAAINHVRDLIASRSIGDLQYLNFTRTNLGPIRSDVNAVYDLMSHDISILLHFLNQTPEWVSAQGASYINAGTEDVAFATFGFPHGVMANVRVSWLDPRKVREITVVGTQKMVVFNDLDASEPVRIYDKGTTREPSYSSFGEFKLATRTGDVVIPYIKQSEPLLNEVRAFVDSVRTRNAPVADGNDGVRAVELLDAVSRSLTARGAPVSLSTPAAHAV